jgi:flagellar biosynthesis protein FlhF
MKIVRHIAPDMRQAMRSIREQLGDDAVILSSRRIPEGVEVTAAIDFDATSLQGAMNAPAETLTATPLPTQPAAASRALASSRTAPAPAPAPPPAPAYSHAAASHYFPAASSAADARPFAHILGQESAQTSIPPRASVAAPTPTPAVAEKPAPVAIVAPHTESVAPATSATVVAQALAELPAMPTAPAGDSLANRSVAAQSSDAMGTEMKMMRRMLETQLAQLAWNDMTRRAPVHVEILRELTEIGISQELSEYILKQLPEKVELGFARRFAIAGLSQYLLVTGDRWLENGGRVAFIGATGVGKTTTLAKLAVRWVLRHGPRDIALVGSDTVRIGAQDQIQSLGQLLGVPVYTPENFESLPTLLGRLGDRHRMILIDTPGSSLRDGQLAHRLGVLSNCASQMETALVLAASTQAGAVEETVKRYASANPACCVLTKVDEAASLGGALSVLIKARLPVSYVSEGQRVPEDLRPARALELVSTAVRLAKTSGAAADEDLLRRRFGKAAHAII